MAGGAYIALLQAARNPFFFNVLSVPDTLDGRFELIVLHLALLHQRLADVAQAPAFCQGLTDAFFADMDRALRELGVLYPEKRIKNMGAAYGGRLQAYGQPLHDMEMLKAALARNLYGTLEQGDVALLDKTARYVAALREHLAAASDAAILSGDYPWPDVAELLGA